MPYSSTLGGKRVAITALSLTLLFPACQGTGMMGTESTVALSPQQQQLRQQSQRWNQTMFTGAGIGALGGAGAGALIDRQNPGRGAAIGAGVGLLSGLLTGVLVANRNLDFEKRELSATQRIAAAHQIASRLEETAITSERVVNENRRKLAQLDHQFHAGQITVAHYQAETNAMRQDVDVMRKTAGEAHEAQEHLMESSRQIPQLINEEPRIASAQQRLTTSANGLEAALRRVPTG